jgi:hypothetical protein
MDERQREKAWKRVLVILAEDSKILEMAKQYFGSSKPTVSLEPTPVPPEEGSLRKKVGAHWIIGIFAGVGVTWDGQYAILIRCLFLLGLLLWLSIDTWKILWKTIVDKKSFFRVAAIQLVFVVLVAMAISSITAHDREKKDQELEAKQRDVARNLIIQEDHQDDPDDPFSATFSLVNNSDARILSNIVTCTVNDVKYDSPNRLSRLFFNNSGKEENFNTPLEPNGSAETFRCPYYGNFPVQGKVVCADILYHVDYVDDLPWPSSFPYKPKERRYYALPGKDGIRWHEEQVGLTKSPCAH